METMSEEEVWGRGEEGKEVRSNRPRRRCGGGYRRKG